ncbi:MAG TPA: hypothetical protein VL972_01815, partial [Solirubrobacteraceae bacterium]|nr:hypothetical protein [Solirubrobacteraceae bacterium]
HDISDPAVLRAELQRMAAELCASLAAHHRRGRTIAIKVRLDDFTTATRAHTLASPTNDLHQVRDVALRLLHRYAPPRPVRLLGVRVAGLAHGAPTTPGARPQRPAQHTPAARPKEPALDQLSLQV